jgi:type I restriction enzyme R subunit
VLRSADTAEPLDLGSAVELTHLRHEASFSGALELSTESGEVKTIFGEGRGPQKLPDMEPLSQIVDTLNERFGLQLTEADQLLFDQYEKDWLADQEVTDRARNNTIENFKLVFDRNFLKTVISRMDENEALFRRILDDPDFQEAVKDFYGAKVCREARKPSD